MGLAFWEQYRCRIAVSGARKPVSTVSDCKAWGQQMTRMPGRVAVAATTIALAVALASPSVGASPSAATPNRSWLRDRGHHMHRGPNGETDVDVCSHAVAPGVAHCDAYVRSDLFGTGVQPRAHGEPLAPGQASENALVGNNCAYDPSYLQSAYNVPAGGVGQTVAVVDAYDAPAAESDLAQYRTKFGLPPCTTANGCFAKVDQNGGHAYPAFNAGWAQETALDIQMVSAICPSCHILLVEATNSDIDNLGAGVNRAVALGANVVSNSYGSDEWSDELLADHDFYNHPGVAIVASTGDSGYGVSYPAASPHVVAVGGTTLLQATNTGQRKAIETVWARGGSGCSTFEPKPVWQTDPGCPRRTVAHVAAVADPSTGVWVYVGADGGWEVFGGTSASAPIVGALYAIAANPSSSADMSSYPYSNSSSLNDVVSGSNGSCGSTYLCTGTTGYDGPSGLGTPSSVTAFKPGGTDTPPPVVPDFALTASPVAAMKPGGTAKSTVTVVPHNGFACTVSFAASTNPHGGVSTSLDAASVEVAGAAPASLTLTLTAHTGCTYNVTVRASTGPLVRTVVLTVPVNDFAINVTPARATVLRGKGAHFTVTLTPSGSLSGAVSLSVAGLRAHTSVFYARNPAIAPGSQQITVTTSTLDARGVLTLRIRGVRGSLSHAAVVTLTVK